MNAIDLFELTRDFNGTLAVDHLTFSVPSGIIFGFLGPNGAGKTTTIRLLLGLLEPTEGQAQVLGFDTCSQAGQIRSRTGALLEHSGLYEQLSAMENLEFYARVYRMPASRRQARIQEVLTGIGLWDRRNEQVKKWSRGMKQKLALARTLLHSPSLILLDEPTAGLDVAAALEVRQKLSNLAFQQGVTIFLTTHNMSEAEKLCHQVAVIRRGRLVAVGNPDKLRLRYGTSCIEIFGRGLDGKALTMLQSRSEVARAEARNGHLWVQLAERADPAPLVSLLEREGFNIDEVRRGKVSLEDVYMSMMEEESRD
jgi:ABC-2 type transport system ATP-binding protein